MKTKKIQSVVYSWVSSLPFTQQALLMLSLRGPDGLPKYNNAKPIIYFLRGVVLKPAYPDFAGMDGFMSTNYDYFLGAFESFWGDTDEYPMHFLMHVVHASEVIAYNHPDKKTRKYWLTFYAEAVNRLHMRPETKNNLNTRLFF